MSKKNINNKNSKSNNLISIVVTINKVTDVAEHMERLSKQVFPNTEILLCNTAKENIPICQHYAYKDCRIKLILPQVADNKTADLKNAAIKEAQGQYIIFMDLEDVLRTQTLEMFLQQFLPADYDAILFDYYVKRDANSNRYISLTNIQIPDFIPLQEFCAQTFPEHIFNLLNTDNLPCIIKTEFLRENKILFSQNIDYANSLFALYVLLHAKKIIYSNTPLIIYTPIKRPVYATIDSYKLLFNEVKKFERVFSKYNKNGLLTTSFLNKILELFWSASNVFGPQECFFKQFLYEQIFPYFQFCNCDADNYISDTCKKLVSTDYIKPVYFETLQSFLNHKDDICPIFINTTYDMEVYGSSVLIQSIKQHASKNKFYDIYVLCYDKKKSSLKDSLENMSDTNVRVSFVTDFNDKYAPDITFNKKHNHLLVAQAVDFYDKVLILSPNTLVKSDVAEIFEYNLSECIFACCRNTREKLDKTEQTPRKLYNTDVMLLNTKAFNEQDLLSQYSENQPTKTLQNILNTICVEQIKTINSVWNVQYWNNLSEYNLNSQLLKKQAKILNYIADKPWNNPQMFLSDQWWSVARQTPFYEFILFCGIRKIANISTDITLPTPENSLPSIAVEQIKTPNYDFNRLINILDKDINNVLKKRQVTQSVYINKINNNENQVYTLMKQYIRLWFKYLVSYGKNREKIKKDMNKIQAEITQNMLK